MHVVATAGHVDHGKSTLVRALTGIEPDRWEEERRRGLTIDLGYAWTTLPTGEQIAFVDVPGHQRFIGNMLAGLGPAPAVMLVVAADEGWREQTQEHLAAITALDIRHGLVVVTRSDLADPAAAVEQTRRRLAATALRDSEIVTVSGRTGTGMTDLRAALHRLLASLPQPRQDGRVRLWVDRSFTVRGSGTIVTGTLGAGALAVGDRVEVGGRTAVVRSLQSLETAHDRVTAVARVAVNLRGVPVAAVGRGDTLLTPGSWRDRDVLDVRLHDDEATLPGHVMVHVGTAAVEARVRPLAEGSVRLTLARGLPLEPGDRMILRDPGVQHVVAGAVVLDIAPPQLHRRGAARRRGEELADTAPPTPAALVLARGWLPVAELHTLTGTETTEDLASSGIRVVAEHAVAPAQWDAWRARLGSVVRAHVSAHPHEARMPLAAVRDAVGLPARELVAPLAGDAGMAVEGGYVQEPGARPSLGAAEAAVSAIEARLAQDPCAAPERHELQAAGVGVREVAVAVRLGRLIDLGDLVLVAPSTPARAMRVLAGLPQPFTTSQARQALGTTRRVVVPLLEHLDGRGWTRRIDAGHREVVR